MNKANKRTTSSPIPEDSEQKKLTLEDYMKKPDDLESMLPNETKERRIGTLPNKENERRIRGKGKSEGESLVVEEKKRPSEVTHSKDLKEIKTESESEEHEIPEEDSQDFEVVDEKDEEESSRESSRSESSGSENIESPKNELGDELKLNIESAKVNRPKILIGSVQEVLAKAKEESLETDNKLLKIESSSEIRMQSRHSSRSNRSNAPSREYSKLEDFIASTKKENLIDEKEEPVYQKNSLIEHYKNVESNEKAHENKAKKNEVLKIQEEKTGKHKQDEHKASDKLAPDSSKEEIKAFVEIQSEHFDEKEQSDRNTSSPENEKIQKRHPEVVKIKSDKKNEEKIVRKTSNSSKKNEEKNTSKASNLIKKNKRKSPDHLFNKAASIQTDLEDPNEVIRTYQKIIKTQAKELESLRKALNSKSNDLNLLEEKLSAVKARKKELKRKINEKSDFSKNFEESLTTKDKIIQELKDKLENTPHKHPEAFHKKNNFSESEFWRLEEQHLKIDNLTLKEIAKNKALWIIKAEEKKGLLTVPEKQITSPNKSALMKHKLVRRSLEPINIKHSQQ